MEYSLRRTGTRRPGNSLGQLWSEEEGHVENRMELKHMDLN